MENWPLIVDSIDDLELKQIECLLDLAHSFKQNDLGHEEELLKKYPRKSAIGTFFLENSTRTKLSFAKAAHNLGIGCLDLDPQRSSLSKGEEIEETFLTLKEIGVDLIVVRSQDGHIFEQFKTSPPVPIINGGAGPLQHPTQALADLFTLIEDGHRPHNLNMAIVGDCRHSRVCGSLVDLMSRYKANVTLVCPPEVTPGQFHGRKNVKITQDLDQALLESDAVYLLRVQSERHESSLKNAFADYTERFQVNLKRLNRLGKKIPIYQAGPTNIGVEIDRETHKSPLNRAYQQVKNGVYMRMALIHSILNCVHSHREDGDRRLL